jgi:hypothetical protein
MEEEEILLAGGLRWGGVEELAEEILEFSFRMGRGCARFQP